MSIGSIHKRRTELALQQIIDAQAASLDRYRHLAAVCYAGLGAEHDLPEEWLDVLNAAANGEPFDVEHLLPYTKEPKA